MTDEDLLLALLNSTPVVQDRARDDLADDAAGRARLVALGGSGSPAELAATRAVREPLQAVARGDAELASLLPELDGVLQRPGLHRGGVAWQLVAPPDRDLAVRAVLALAALTATAPGRLRPCANPACRLYLLDRSRAGTARWCSMATCGNRLKARRHHDRARAGTA